MGSVAVMSQPDPQRMDNLRWRDSLTVLNREIARSPYSTDLHLRKAAVNLELQQWEFAVDEYKTILRHEENNLAALFYRAYAYTHLRRYDLAKNDYTDFLRQSPTHLEARMGLAYVWQLMGRRNDALEELNRVVQQHPDSAIGYAARAALETEMNLYDAALYDWDEVLSRSPRHTEYSLSRIDVLIRMGKKEQARQSLEQLKEWGVPTSALREWYQKVK